MKILALDYGRKRIGLATAGYLKIAHPQQVLKRTELKNDLEELQTYIEENDIEEIVIGLPKNMDNTQGEMAQEATAFAHALEKKCQLPITLWDERLSSWEAEKIIRQSSNKRKKTHQKIAQNIDAIAAAVILQCYLDQKT